ncbi:MAG: D-aminoacyl-tRNA deacylase, partial [Pseudomonadota bacterium]
MRALLQRVSEARVDVDGKTIGQIGPGLLVLVCGMPSDTPELVERLSAKISKIRVFAD